MDVIKLLNCLQEIIENSSKIPITGKILVDKKELMDVIDEIINYLPDEFKKAQWVVEEKERILSEAIREADSLKKESVGMLKKHIENHNITREATARAEQVIAAAQRDSKSMRLGARDYADEILSQLDKEITSKGQEMIVNLKGDMETFLESLSSQVQNTGNTIRSNVKELRNIK